MTTFKFDDPNDFPRWDGLCSHEQWALIPKERRLFLYKAAQYHVETQMKQLSQMLIDDVDYDRTQKNLNDMKKIMSLIESYENSISETIPVLGID